MEKSSCYLALCWFFNPILKNGSYSDLPLSIKPDNIFPMLSAGIKNIPLTKYLIQQVRQSPKDRIDALKEYVPSAKSGLDN
jgi:malate dehydrogenase (quinone)